MILPMIQFVNSMKTSERGELATKAASDAFELELKDNGTIIVSVELKTSRRLVEAGHLDRSTWGHTQQSV